MQSTNTLHNLISNAQEHERVKSIDFMKKFILKHLNVQKSDLEAMNEEDIINIYNQLSSGLEEVNVNQSKQEQKATKSQNKQQTKKGNGSIDCQKNDPPIQVKQNLVEESKFLTGDTNQIAKITQDLSDEESEREQSHPNPYIKILQAQKTYYHPRRALKQSIFQNNRYRIAFVEPRPKANQFQKMLSLLKTLLTNKQFKMVEKMHPRQIKNMYNQVVQERKKENWFTFYKSGKRNGTDKQFKIIIPKVQVPQDIWENLQQKSKSRHNEKQNRKQAIYTNEINDASIIQKPSAVQGKKKSALKKVQKYKTITTVIQRVEEIQSQDESLQIRQQQAKRVRSYQSSTEDLQNIIEKLNSAPAKLFIPDSRIPYRKIVNPDLMAWVKLLKQRCEELQQNCPQFIDDFSSENDHISHK